MTFASEARAHAPLRGRDARGRRPRGVRRRGRRQARIQRVPLGPASGRRRGASPGLRRGSTAIPTSMPGSFAAGSPSGSRSTPPGWRSATARARSCWPPRRRCASPATSSLFAWPSFSIYPHLAALSGAREIRVPLADGYVHDLDAMLAEVTAATQLVCVCNPNNPTGTHLGVERIAEFCERVPDHVTVDPRRGLRRVPDRRRPRREHRPARASSRTWWCCARSARARPGRAAVSATRCARPASARRSTRSASRSASTSWPRWPRPRRSSTATTSSRGSSERSWSGCSSRRASRELGLEPPRLAGELLLGAARRPRRGRGDPGPRGARRRRARRERASASPGHIRVTYGTSRRERAVPRRARRDAGELTPPPAGMQDLREWPARGTNLAMNRASTPALPIALQGLRPRAPGSITGDLARRPARPSRPT